MGRRIHEARASQDAGSEPARRALNVLVAAVGLLLLSPLMTVIGLAIRATSQGPVLYTQARVGLDRRRNGSNGRDGMRHTDVGGKPFNIYKFRTMHAHHSRNGTEIWARPDDPRVTRLGRILRLYRLDELPQLINVLKGEMNIVGPRPEQPAIFANLREQVDGYEHRQRERPGITGWAQIQHQYDSTVDDVRRKVALDLEYIGRSSTLEDLKIMLRTIPVVVFKRGAW
jgi:lipopolysaccharide/colanic/teichoic acid biosynthesis glycosyltransferase